MVGAFGDGIELTQRQHRPPHLLPRGDFVGRPVLVIGMEIPVEEVDRPCRSGRPRARRHDRRLHEVVDECRQGLGLGGARSVARGQVPQSLAPLRGPPHHSRLRRQRVPSADRHPPAIGPRHDGCARQPGHHVVARPVRGGQVQQAEQRRPRHRPVEASRLGPVGGDAGRRQRLVEGAGVGGARRVEDRQPPRRPAGVDRRHHGADRGAHLVVGVGTGADFGQRAVAPVRGDRPGSGARRHQVEDSALRRCRHRRAQAQDGAQGGERPGASPSRRRWRPRPGRRSRRSRVRADGSAHRRGGGRGLRSDPAGGPWPPGWGPDNAGARSPRRAGPAGHGGARRAPPANPATRGPRCGWPRGRRGAVPGAGRARPARAGRAGG